MGHRSDGSRDEHVTQMGQSEPALLSNRNWLRRALCVCHQLWLGASWGRCPEAETSIQTHREKPEYLSPESNHP